MLASTVLPFLAQVALLTSTAAALVIAPGEPAKELHGGPGTRGTCGAQCTDLPPQNSTSAAVPAAIKLPCSASVLAPDGSEVRDLATTPKASMANFRLGAGLVTVGVHHRTVDEVWYIVGGRGQIWRAPGGKPEEGKVDKLEPGISVAIPVGTHFQFRADNSSTLDIIGVDTPAWPGDGEAVVSDIAPWTPTVTN